MTQLAFDWNQRWRSGRDSYRPAGELIDTRAYDVARLEDDARPKAFVQTHHYSGSYPAARERFGLFRRGELVGTAVFSVPCRDEVLTSVFPDAQASVELGRLVLLDDVPGNGETWFLARALRLLAREGFVGVLSFSDPFPRAALDGSRVFPGHVGTIYQAGNATYLGRSGARSLKLLPDGRVLSARAISKLRAGERGWRSSAAPLVAAGAPPPPEDADRRRTWLKRALARFTRTIRHPGNHKYAWSLDRAVRLPFGPYLARPKKGTEA
jgi:hypothetical protein